MPRNTKAVRLTSVHDYVCRSLLILCVWSVQTIQAAQTIYVDAARPDDSGNGLSWNEAKQTIQAAVNLAVDGDTVLVTNGVYDRGGAVSPLGTLTNRVCVTNDILVR